MEQVEPVKALELRRALGRRPGRPSALDDEKLAAFFHAIRVGARRRQAARYAGINIETMENWVARGRGLDPQRPPKPEYVRFVEMLDLAEAQLEVGILVDMATGIKGKPAEQMEFLGRRFPERWRRFSEGNLTDDPEELLRLPSHVADEPKESVEVKEITRTRTMVVPASQLSKFADGVYLTKRGVESAPSLAGLSSGPDDDDTPEAG